MTPYDDALEELYQTAYKVAYRMLGSHHDAEEIAQEVSARALVRWAQVASYAQAWGARTATNLVLDRLRRSSRRLPLVERVQSPAGAERVELVRMLRSLPKRQREVVVLRYLVDLSEEDVATKLGCAPGTVRQHAHRGLAALRADETLADQER
jgi:RNA polymerase sigma-70 factor (ECF subfamily)